jgi:hypothetical protein
VTKVKQATDPSPTTLLQIQRKHQSYAKSASGPAAAGFCLGFWCVTGNSTSFGSTCNGGNCLAAPVLRRTRGGTLRGGAPLPLLPRLLLAPPALLLPILPSPLALLLLLGPPAAAGLVGRWLPGPAAGLLRGWLLAAARAARSGTKAARGSCSHATAMTSGLRLLNQRAAFCTASMTSPSTWLREAVAGRRLTAALTACSIHVGTSHDSNLGADSKRG